MSCQHCCSFKITSDRLTGCHRCPKNPADGRAKGRRGWCRGPRPGWTCQSGAECQSRSCQAHVFASSHTYWPVQNMGHRSHGLSRASCRWVFRYGLRTMRGSVGGSRWEALAVMRAMLRLARPSSERVTPNMMRGIRAKSSDLGCCRPVQPGQQCDERDDCSRLYRVFKEGRRE